jgi:hypothetical protein
MSALEPTRWGIAGAGLISHDFANAIQTLSSNDHKYVYISHNLTSSTVMVSDVKVGSLLSKNIFRSTEE